MKLSICITFLLTCNAIYLVNAKSTPAPQVVEILKLPQGFPTCPEDEHINECLHNAFSVIVRTAVNGVPEINIPPLDPFVLERLNLQFANNLISGRVVVRNVAISEFSKKKQQNVQYERQGNKLKLVEQFSVPKLHVEGQYKADVQLLNAAKYIAKGTFDITMIDIEAQFEYFAELYERDGHKFIKLLGVNVEPSVGDMHISATGLIAEPTLNESFLQIANENWRSLYKDAIAANKPYWEPVLLKYANDFFAHIPFDSFVTNPKT